MFETVKQQVLAGGVISLLSILLAIVFFTNLGRAPEPLRITIAEAHQPVFALLYIAQEKGFFKDQALQVNYHRFTSGGDALDNLLLNVLRGEAQWFYQQGGGARVEAGF